MRRIEGIINSMTPKERAHPELIKASRKRRIAAGAGVQVQEVNRLLNQFEQMQKMMKHDAKGGMAQDDARHEGDDPRHALKADGGHGMKITSIDACVLTVPTSRQMALEFPQHKLVVAEIATDEGVRGLGYSLVFGGGGAGFIVYLETRLKPLLIGEDPLAVERLWEKMYRGDRGVRRVGIAGMALSALDIGLWDIAGKAAKLPLYKLWGAVTDRVACYGSGGWGNTPRKTCSPKPSAMPAWDAATTR